MSAEIGYAVVLADQLDKTRSLSFQLNFARGATEAEMNSELDKLVNVLDRQRAKAAIYEAEQFLKAQRNILKGIEDDLVRGENKLAILAQPDSTRRNVPNEATQLKANVEQQRVMLSSVRDKIAAAEEELKQLRDKAA